MWICRLDYRKSAILPALGLLVSFAGTQLSAADSPHSKITVPAKHPAEPLAPPEEHKPILDKWAVVIGIDKFKDPSIPPLKYPTKDARDFARFLVEKGHFAQDHILLLTNEQATKYNIELAIGDDWLPRRAAADDLIVFFASTHGSPKEIDVAGENFLVAYDTDPKKLFTTGVKFADLAPVIKQRTGCQRIVLLLDACDSGAANVGKGLIRKGNFDVENMVGEGQIVISSSSADQRSYESERYDNGVFTRQLISSLQSKGSNTTLKEAFDSLKAQVENEVRFDRMASQTPVMRSKWKGGELILIAVPAQPRSVPSQPAQPVTAESSPEEIFQRGKKLVEAQKFEEAARVLPEAAQAGHARAQVWLADLYRQGKGVTQSFARAAELYQKAADQGNAAAQFYLGWFSATGNGLPQNLSKAAEWYQKSADQGESAAQLNLGALYAHGDGVPQNLSKAAEWYQKAAAQGNMNARAALAGLAQPNSPPGAEGQSNTPEEIFQRGNKLVEAQKYGEAARVLEEAAQAGHPRAQVWLADLYRQGKGVKQDFGRAADLYQKAAGQGNAAAQFYLGWMSATGIGLPKNLLKAADWYQKSAEQGEASAQCNLGFMLEHGDGVKKDEGRAAEWYLKSALQGNAFAQYNIGSMYERGCGVVQDEAKAITWYRKSAAQGNANANESLKKLENK